MKARLNVVISGGTGSGKTTLLNTLSGFISNKDRIVTIEDAAELQLQQDPCRSTRNSARPTSKAKAQSLQPNLSRTRCGCVLSVSSSVSAVALKPSTCFKP